MLLLFILDNLTQEQICHPLGNEKTIKITRALIVEPSYIFKVDRSSGLKCKYIIKTSHHENLMVVIQNLSFRRNGSECLDYVRVSASCLFIYLSFVLFYK